jgi:hypothetical protein
MKKSLLLLAAPLFFTACQPDSESVQTNTTETIVSNVVLPDTVKVGDVVDVQLTYQVLNDCGKYVGTDVFKSGNSILVRPFVQYTYQNIDPCPNNITTGDETVSFKAENPGKYFFLFKKEAGAGYDADTLVVQ